MVRYCSYEVEAQGNKYIFADPVDFGEKDILQQKIDSLHYLTDLVNKQIEFYTLIQYELELISYSIDMNMLIDFDEVRRRYFANCNECMSYADYIKMQTID